MAAAASIAITLLNTAQVKPCERYLLNQQLFQDGRMLIPKITADAF